MVPGRFIAGCTIAMRGPSEQKLSSGQFSRGAGKRIVQGGFINVEVCQNKKP